MKHILTVALMLAVAGLVYAQAQADVTTSIVLKAADVSALKAAILTQTSERLGTGETVSPYVVMVNGVPTVTDAKLQEWVTRQVNQARAQIIKRNVDATMQTKIPTDWSALTDAQRAQVAALLDSFKK